jgi:hypothetical protein
MALRVGIDDGGARHRPVASDILAQFVDSAHRQLAAGRWPTEGSARYVDSFENHAEHFIVVLAGGIRILAKRFGSSYRFLDAVEFRNFRSP